MCASRTAFGKTRNRKPGGDPGDRGPGPRGVRRGASRFQGGQRGQPARHPRRGRDHLRPRDPGGAVQSAPGDLPVARSPAPRGFPAAGLGRPRRPGRPRTPERLLGQDPAGGAQPQDPGRQPASRLPCRLRYPLLKRGGPREIHRASREAPAGSSYGWARQPPRCFVAFLSMPVFMRTATAPPPANTMSTEPTDALVPPVSLTLGTRVDPFSTASQVSRMRAKRRLPTLKR